MVDDYSELANGDFFEHKDDMVEPTCELFHLWQQAGMPVKVLRCDNGGEYYTLRKRLRSSDWKMNIKFQFTASQSNSTTK